MPTPPPDELPPLSVFGAPKGDVLVLGWGSTCGAIQQAVQHLRDKGHAISAVHLRHMNPLPKDLGEILGRFKTVVIPELNLGQLQMLVRARYLVDAQGIHKIKGKPFRVSELISALEEYLS